MFKKNKKTKARNLFQDKYHCRSILYIIKQDIRLYVRVGWIVMGSPGGDIGKKI